MNDDVVRCEGYLTDITDNRDFDCGYGVTFPCDNCVRNSGTQDPREEESNGEEDDTDSVSLI